MKDSSLLPGHMSRFQMVFGVYPHLDSFEIMESLLGFLIRTFARERCYNMDAPSTHFTGKNETNYKPAYISVTLCVHLPAQRELEGVPQRRGAWVLSKARSCCLIFSAVFFRAVRPLEILSPLPIVQLLY